MICSALEHLSVSSSFILWGWNYPGSQPKAWKIFQATPLLLVALVLTSLDAEAVNSSAQHLCCITRSFREKVAPDVSGFLSFSRSWTCDFLLPCLLPDTPESRASQVVLMITHLPMQQTRDSVSNPGSGRSAGGGHGNHSRILAWRRPWTEEPGGLQSMGSQRVEYTWSNWARTPESNFQKIFFKQLLVVRSWEFSPSYLVQHDQK